MSSPVTHTAWRALPAATPLDRRYDADRLADEVRSLHDRPWHAQRSVGQQGMIRKSDVDWTILSLRSPGGDPDRTDAGGAGLREHADTPYLLRAPSLAELVHSFPTQLLAVRLMSLGAGARVRDHRDAKCGLPWGLVRLHVPITTNPAAFVVIGGHEYHWGAGQLWFGDFNRVHHVRNGGATARIHLVLDCLVTAELLRLFPVEIAGGLPADEVLVARCPVPLAPADRAALACRFEMPARFAEWSEEEPVAGAEETVPAEVTRLDGELVLSVAGRPAFGLVHLGAGEFRLAGWSEERTLRVDLDGAAPAVRFRVRVGSAVTEWVHRAERVAAV
ncbi:MAG: aspartyl/asparaginyl beta-hydroxylase domain-containing protein [Actinocatenispora sp.]